MSSSGKPKTEDAITRYFQWRLLKYREWPGLEKQHRTLPPRINRHSYNVLDYDHNTVESFPDKQLADLAEQAKQEMNQDFEKRRDRDFPGIRKPAAFSVIAAGRRIDVASSIKLSTILSLMNRQFCAKVKREPQAPRTTSKPVVASSQQQTYTKH